MRQIYRRAQIGLLGAALVVAAEAKDYGEGFSRFYKLGLPDVRDAEYVELTLWGSHFSGLHGLRQKLTGNAWLVEEVKDGASTFVMNPAERKTVWDRDTLMEIRREEREKTGETTSVHVQLHSYKTDARGRMPGTWKEADYEADLETLVEYLEEVIEDEEEYRVRSSAGTCFLMAAQAYRLGYTNRANAIVESLFEIVGDPRTVVVAGLGSLADAKYAEAYQSFLGDRDWQAFAGRLGSIRGTFRVGWRKGESIDLLLERVKARLEDPDPPLPENDALAETDRSQAAALLTLRDPDGFDQRLRQGVWLLPGSEERSAYMPSAAASGTNVLYQIAERGVDAVPLLMALLEDRTLTALPLESLSGTRHVSFGGHRSLNEEQIRRQYRAMPRPAERADVARLYLQPILLMEDDERREMRSWPAADLLAEVERWYERFEGMSRLELAQIYMREGDSDLRASAIRYLVARQDPAVLEEVEDVLLTATPAEDLIEAAQAYVRQRQGEARAFADDFIARFEDVYDLDQSAEPRMPQEGGSFDYNDWRSRQNIKMLQQIRKMSRAKPLSDILAAIAAGETDLSRERAVLMMRFQDISPSESVEMLLEAALTTTNAVRRSELVKMVNAYGAFRWRPAEEDTSPPALEEHADLWTQLLDDDVAEESPWPGRSSVTLRDFVSQRMVYLYGPDDRSDYHAVHRLGEAGRSWFTEWARARLESDDPGDWPAVPDPDAVAAEDLDKLVASLTEAAPEECRALLRDADMSMCLAVTEAAADDESLRAVLAEKLGPITEVVVRGEGLDEEALREVFLDRRVDEDTLKEGVQILKEHLNDGRAAGLNIERLPLLRGIRVSVWGLDAGEIRQNREGWLRPSTEKALVSGYTRIPSAGLHRAEWLAETPGDEASEDEAGGMDDLLGDALAEVDDVLEEEASETKQEFWEAVRVLYQPDSFPLQYASVTFLGLPAAPQPE